MAILSVCKLSESTFRLKDISLRQPCRKIEKEEINEEWFKRLLTDMFETLYHAPCGVGLAAPQVGVQVQLIVIDIKRNGKNPLVLINPEYSPLSNEMVQSTESCISVPKLEGTVDRYKKIVVNYIDAQGNPKVKECDGFQAIVLQHEIDHINGIVYIDKIDDDKKISRDEGPTYNMAVRAVETVFEEK